MRSAEELQLTSALWILTSFATMCQLISASPLERETERERERERESVRACAEFSFKQNKTFNQFSINYWVVCVCVCVCTLNFPLNKI